MRGDARELGISRHHHIGRNSLHFVSLRERMKRGGWGGRREASKRIRRRPNVSSEVSSKFLACVLRSGAGDVWGKGRRKYRGGRSAGGGGVGVFRRNADRLYWSTPLEVLHTNTREAGAAELWRNQTATDGMERLI